MGLFRKKQDRAIVIHETGDAYCGPVTWTLTLLGFLVVGPFAFLSVCCPCDYRDHSTMVAQRNAPEEEKQE